MPPVRTCADAAARAARKPTKLAMLPPLTSSAPASRGNPISSAIQRMVCASISVAIGDNRQAPTLALMAEASRSPSAPIGALGDLLASAINANVGAWRLSPMATEIEAQTIRWIAELIGFPRDAGALLVSGGNMANFVGFLAARAAASAQVRTGGIRAEAPLRVYASAETHTWIQKAADLFGLGTDAIRWVPTDDQQQMDTAALEHQIVVDAGNGE